MQLAMLQHSDQLASLSSALLPTDTVKVMEELSSPLVWQIDGIWEMRKQAKFLEAALLYY